MSARQQAWPRIWLMTDERMGDALWPAIDRLPDEAGIVFRHYSLDAESRIELARQVAQAARPRALTLAIAGDVRLAEQVDARLVHNPSEEQPSLPFSRSVHSMEEATLARDAGAALVFVSPVLETRSHPAREALGIERAAELARTAQVPAIALGGMSAERFALLQGRGFYGWAAIDAWLAPQGDNRLGGRRL